jgi:hypothetical protein
MIVGEPKPQYILFRYYGPEEKRIIAGTQHNLDLFDDITPESWDILRAQDSSAKTFLNTFPWADMDDPCERGIQLLDSKPPFVKTEVRWAFADGWRSRLPTRGVSLASQSTCSSLNPVHSGPPRPMETTTPGRTGPAAA